MIDRTQLPTYNQIEEYYGAPGDPENLTTIIPPYPMYLAWNPKVQVRKITVHKLLSVSLWGILDDIKTEYGLLRIKELGLDQYGGCLNVRKMRGGKKWSTHAWAIAIDLDPVNNRLRWHKDKAHFARPEYKAMIDLFYHWGWVSLGREKDYDWMHFQSVLV